MLSLGKKKLAGSQQSASIQLVNADALFLPFGRCLFDGIFIAFGIRNIMNRKKALIEFQNALKPGKRLVILELTTPKNPVLKSLYLLYFKRILPWIGELFSRHRQAYQYLPDSVLGFPEPREFARIMASAGFRNIRFKPMTAGIVTLFVGEKAGNPL
jgi:demethylmenaquinone methyltransferase/2-methoxy-6-polyprenyl-1,4-benzoquinol methylase